MAVERMYLGWYDKAPNEGKFKMGISTSKFYDVYGEDASKMFEVQQLVKNTTLDFSSKLDIAHEILK